MIAVVTAEVGDDAEEWNDLAFDGGFEAVHADAVVAGQTDVAVGISEKDVAAGYLRMSERRKRNSENEEKNATTHECSLMIKMKTVGCSASRSDLHGGTCNNTGGIL